MNTKAMEIQYVVALLLALGAAAVAFVFIMKIQNVQPPFQQTDYCAATGMTWTQYTRDLSKATPPDEKKVLKDQMLSCFPTREQEIARL